MYFYCIIIYCIGVGGCDGSVGVATGYGLDGPGTEWYVFVSGVVWLCIVCLVVTGE
jgi:hypothetical protein